MVNNKHNSWKKWSKNLFPVKYIISFLPYIFVLYWDDSLRIFQLIHVWSLTGYHLYSSVSWGFQGQSKIQMHYNNRAMSLTVQ